MWGSLKLKDYGLDLLASIHNIVMCRYREVNTLYGTYESYSIRLLDSRKPVNCVDMSATDMVELGSIANIRAVVEMLGASIIIESTSISTILVTLENLE